MKNKLILLSTVLLCMCLFISCSKDEETDYAPQLAGNYSGDYADSSDWLNASENEPATVAVTGKNKVKITFTKKSKSYEINIDPEGSNNSNIVCNNSKATLSYSVSSGTLSVDVETISYQAVKSIQK